MKQPFQILDENPCAFSAAEHQLRAHGATPAAITDPEFGTLLHRLIGTQPAKTRRREYTQWQSLVYFLLHHAPNLLRTEDRHGLNPLMLACKRSLDLPWIEKLCGPFSASELVSRQLGTHAIHCILSRSVVSKQSPAAIVFLGKHGFPPDARDPETGWTPLMYAAFMDNPGDLKALLQIGARTDIQGGGKNGLPRETAAQLAQRLGRHAALALLQGQAQAAPADPARP